MDKALNLAYQTLQLSQTNLNSDIPVGSIIVDTTNHNKIIGISHQKKQLLQDPTAHSEILAIKQACRNKNSWRLQGCVLYSTLEPCIMCTGAIILSRISLVVFGAHNSKFGGMGGLIDLSKVTNINHRPKIISGIKHHQCSELMIDFFKNLRTKKPKDINI